jgi:arginine exporter protein ArgO
MINSSVRHEKKILAAILFLALGLRVWGLHFGLPGLFHADEPIVLNHALAYATGDFNPHFFKIPPLVSYLLFGVFGLCYGLGHLLGYFQDTAHFERFFYTDPSYFYLIARLIFGALAGTVTVGVFYFSVRRHFDARRALTAAFLLAGCFLHVTDSHYLYADIPLLLVIVLSFGVFWNLNAAAGFRGHLMAGAVIGLATALKYNGVFVGLLYGVMLFGTKIKLLQKIKTAVAAAGVSGLIFTLLNPYWILDFIFFLGELKKQSLSQSGVGWLHHGVYSLPGAVGLPLLLAALAGACAVMAKTQSADVKLKRVSLLVFTAGYYVVLACSGQPYPRYVLPLLPGILFFAADFLCSITAECRRRFFFCAGLLLLSAFPLAKSVLWDRLMSTPDVRLQAKAWIETNLASGTSLALDWDFYMPRLNFTIAQLREKKNEVRHKAHFQEAQLRRLDTLIDHQRNEPSYKLHFLVPEPEKQERFLMASPVLPYNLNRLKADNIEYVLLALGAPQADSPDFYRAIQSQARLVKIFSPYRDESLESIDSVAMTGGPFTWSEIAARKANGHAVSLYQMVDPMNTVKS